MISFGVIFESFNKEKHHSFMQTLYYAIYMYLFLNMYTEKKVVLFINSLCMVLGCESESVYV